MKARESAGSTKVENTMGRCPEELSISLILSAAACAFSTVSMKGRRCCSYFRFGNCVRTECASVSAVMAVPSLTMKTVRKF